MICKLTLMLQLQWFRRTWIDSTHIIEIITTTKIRILCEKNMLHVFVNLVYERLLKLVKRRKERNNVRLQIKTVYNSSVSYTTKKKKNHMDISRTVFVSVHVIWPVDTLSASTSLAILDIATQCFESVLWYQQSI